MKFRRKADASPSSTDGSQEPAVEPDPAVGPFDADDLAEDGVERVDLGSLLVAPQPGRELRLQVDEKTNEVQAVLLAGPDGAVELRAFAAPRHGDLWSEVRPQIAADMKKRGGVATEAEGTFGTELRCELMVKRADGTSAAQPSRIVGVNGGRWLLRATFMGRPAMDEEISPEWVDTIRSVAVRRGAGAMPVGEPLPVVLPDRARRVQPPTP